MDDIICIILIFFILGLILNNFIPIYEGLCETKWNLQGELKKLPEAEQKEYEKISDGEKNNVDTNNEFCVKKLINDNLALVKSFSKDNSLKKKYNKKLKPASVSFDTTKIKFNKAVEDLINGKDGTAGDGKGKSCGGINDPVGASPGDIGKPIEDVPNEANCG